jgi:hypothetical protein
MAFAVEKEIKEGSQGAAGYFGISEDNLLLPDRKCDYRQPPNDAVYEECPDIPASVRFLSDQYNEYGQEHCRRTSFERQHLATDISPIIVSLKASVNDIRCVHIAERTLEAVFL